MFFRSLLPRNFYRPKFFKSPLGEGSDSPGFAARTYLRLESTSHDVMIESEVCTKATTTVTLLSLTFPCFRISKWKAHTDIRREDLRVTLLSLAIPCFRISTWKAHTNIRREDLRVTLLSLAFPCFRISRWKAHTDSRREDITSGRQSQAKERLKRSTKPGLVKHVDDICY